MRTIYSVSPHPIVNYFPLHVITFSWQFTALVFAILIISMSLFLHINLVLIRLENTEHDDDSRRTMMPLFQPQSCWKMSKALILSKADPPRHLQSLCKRGDDTMNDHKCGIICGVTTIGWRLTHPCGCALIVSYNIWCKAWSWQSDRFRSC